MLGERQDLGLALVAGAGHDLDLGHALGQAQRGLDRLGQASVDPVAQHQPVDDDLDVVHLVALELQPWRAVVVGARHIGELDDLTVDAGADEAFGREVGHQGVVGALAAADDRGQDLEPGPFLHRQHPIDDLLRCLADEALAGLGVVGDADAGEQQAEVVVDLGDGADRGPRVAARALLVDRDGR